jgi:3-hydroxy-9,10-secoandrosta-1,3,5(10)-triene-9,17-dione monooxygenase
MSTTETRPDLPETARRLAPAIQARASETELPRRIPDETMAELRDSGLIHALMPSRYGGAEIDPVTTLDAIFEISKACASTGWVLGVIAVHDWNLAGFDPRPRRKSGGTGKRC